MMLMKPKRRLISRPEEDVFRRREIVAEGKVLVDDLDALLPRVDRLVEMLRLAVDPHLAVRRRKVAGDDFHQRRLAGAIVAHEAQDLARMQREVDAPQRLDRAEMLGYSLELENRHPASLSSLAGPCGHVRFLELSRGHAAVKGRAAMRFRPSLARRRVSTRVSLLAVRIFGC